MNKPRRPWLSRFVRFLWSGIGDFAGPHRRPRVILRLELLEDRTVPCAPAGNIHTESIPMEPHAEADSHDLDFLYAPGTPDSYTSEHPDAFRDPESNLRFQFNDANRWTTTATNGPGLVQGDPTTITWSILPDGTNIPNLGDPGPAAPSDLVAFFDGLYGAGPGGPNLTLRPWFFIFQNSFNRWSALTGLTYVYEPSDDGAAFVASPGALGLRGDVRIGGRLIDNAGSILAFNAFPNIGDMVFDTTDGAVFGNATSLSLNARNIIMHEHGHGLGIDHECPVQQNTLMEPFLSTLFDGPQLDDILAGHRGYGDAREKPAGNNTTATATPLGFLGTGSTVTVGLSGAGATEAVAPAAVDFVSIDDDSDIDVFSFSVASATQVTLTLTPLGPTYLSGPQVAGVCTAGVSFNAARQNDLQVELLNGAGLSLATANAAGLGGTETIVNFPTPGGGPFFARITGANNTVQLYQIAIAPTPGSSGNGGDSGSEGSFNYSGSGEGTFGNSGSGGSNGSEGSFGSGGGRSADFPDGQTQDDFAFEVSFDPRVLGMLYGISTPSWLDFPAPASITSYVVADSIGANVLVAETLLSVPEQTEMSIPPINPAILFPFGEIADNWTKNSFFEVEEGQVFTNLELE